MIEIDRIYNEDCLLGMQRIEDDTIDAIICDPPFGTTACAWDCVIPFEPMWEQFRRVVKPSAPVVLFGSQPFTSFLIASNVQHFREELIWIKNKSASGFFTDKRHLKAHENIAVFSYSSNYTFNPETWKTDENYIIKRRTMTIAEETNNIAGLTISGRVRKEDNGNRQPISLLPFKVPYSPKKESKTKNGDFRLHPTQKPVDLLRYLIRTYSNEGDTVLDATIGSGTTMIAAIREKRHWIGFETNKEYFEIASRRIADELRQPTLF
ncbi:MAG: site-specific DNA-methyltransferase [Paludibacteraceae bacterium]|nr:site-specific DNA-methyltransferase [Paludibacteraceae bacterium]